jgi:hypothetical protein
MGIYRVKFLLTAVNFRALVQLTGTQQAGEPFSYSPCIMPSSERPELTLLPSFKMTYSITNQDESKPLRSIVVDHGSDICREAAAVRRVVALSVEAHISYALG